MAKHLGWPQIAQRHGKRGKREGAPFRREPDRHCVREWGEGGCRFDVGVERPCAFPATPQGNGGEGGAEAKERAGAGSPERVPGKGCALRWVSDEAACVCECALCVEKGLPREAAGKIWNE